MHNVTSLCLFEMGKSADLNKNVECDYVMCGYYTCLYADTTVAQVVSFSSGLFPAWIPLSFVYNMLCCYAPFSGNGMNTNRIEAIRKSTTLPITVIAETKCNCCPS